MKKTVTFENMEHSSNLEEHANSKLKKIEDMLQAEENWTPHYTHLWFKANKQHPHHRVDLQLKTPLFDLHSHGENTDMYVALDEAIDKMVKLLKKHKDKLHDKITKVDTPKSDFINKGIVKLDSSEEE